jgi:hypothetical protein
MHHFSVRFTGVQVRKDKIRHTTKIYKVYADDSHRAIDQARAQVQKDPKLQSLFYPSYSIASIEDN